MNYLIDLLNPFFIPWFKKCNILLYINKILMSTIKSSLFDNLRKLINIVDELRDVGV